MKTYTATLVTKQYQTVRVTVPDDCTEEDLILEICENSYDGDCFHKLENEVYDIEEVTA
jgi:hypothetical protein